jgi:NitT/TauT family transport system substrate-binding protein
MSRGNLDRGDFIKLGALASAGGVIAAPGTASAQDLKTVNVLAVPTDGAKSLLYAQKAGLFRKHGVDASIVSMGSGAAIFAAVVGGAADVGSGSLFPVFAAYSRSIPLRIIAPASLYTSANADALLLVKKDSPLRSGHDLNGKTIGVDAIKDLYSVATRAWVDQHGGDGSSVKPVELKPSEQAGALDSGRIDAAVFKTPFVTIAMDSGKFRVLGKPLDAIGPRFLVSGWVSSVDFITKNPALVNGFAQAMAEAAKYTNAHQSETTDLVAAFTGQDAAQVGHGVRSITAESISLADLQRPMDFAVKYGIMDKAFDVKGVLASSVPLGRS